MKTKIWKKICKRIRIIENDKGLFEVQIRYFYKTNKRYNTWEYLNSFNILGAAISQKHHYIENFVMRNVGFKNALKKRRLKRKNG